MKFTIATTTAAIVTTAATLGGVEGRKSVPKWLRHTYNNNNQIPLDSGRDWITLPNGLEYQPGPVEDEINDVRMANLRARSLGYSSSGSSYETNYDKGYQRGAYKGRKDYSAGDANAMTTPYVDGSESYYDEYAQAWRVLGWYIDCDSTFMNYEGDDEGNGYGVGCQRYLLWASYIDLDYEGNGMNEYMYFNRQSGSWSDKACLGYNNTISEQYNQAEDADDNDGADEADDNNDAADADDADAADEEDNADDADAADEQDADDAADEEDEEDDGNRKRKLDMNVNMNMFSKYEHRCVKMDCHLPSTHYKLLGIFKEPHYDEWMEQLFKHQGDCVWDDFEYQFMQMNRDAWPNGCTATNIMDKDGNVIYYDLKPEAYGSMSVGLYIDNNCVTEYTGGSTVEDVLSASAETYYDQYGNIVNNYDYEEGGEEHASTIEDEIEQWNNAFDVFKQCQPCKTFNLVEFVAGVNATTTDYNKSGSRHAKTWEEWGYGSTEIVDYDGNNNYNNNNDDDDDDDDGETYTCYADADYDGMNQCMKFATTTKMVVAQFGDLMIANHQGSTTGFTMVGQGKFGKFPKPGLTGIGQYFHRWWSQDSTETPNSSYKKRYGEDKTMLNLSIALLSFAFLFFALSLGWFYGTSTTRNEKLEEPLMYQSETDYEDTDAMNMMHRQNEIGANEELPPPTKTLMKIT